MATRRHVIAILDDDAVVRHAVAKLLTTHGYATETYGSAEEFLTATTSAATCLVVDVELGDITGVELARHLAASGNSLPVIFMTGSDDETMRSQAIELGCVAYLYKSTLPGRLIEAIASATGSNVSAKK